MEWGANSEICLKWSVEESSKNFFLLKNLF